jgi:ribosomal protein S18 acetylase RimI-like enzyme
MSALRLATPEDLPRVREIVEAAYTPYVARMGQKPGPMLDDYAAHQASGRLSVLEDGGRVVGILVLIDEPDALLLDNVAVDPAVRGRGLGRRLMTAAEEAARTRGHACIRLYTHALMTENQALYRRTGWTETGRMSEKGFDRVYFEKRLEPPAMTDGPTERPAAEGIVKLENDRVRVMEWRFAPGAATGWHVHEYDYVIVPLATGRLRIVDAAGTETVAELSHGEPYSRPKGTAHDVINASDGPFAFMEVEIK